MIKVLELFGGIGACTQAFKKLNIPIEIADYVEIDKYAVQSYNAINGTNFEPQDITKWDKDIEVDFIMHGSPCQDFSLAGKQAGGDKGSGTRSSLMYETLRIVKKLKPKYVLWENVKNAISKKHKHNFNKYLETLELEGYNSYYKVLNAKDYGIPQNRERVFCLSIRKDIDNGYTFPEKQELKLRLKDMLEDNVGEKYYLSNNTINYLENGKYKEMKVSTKLKYTSKGICPTLDTMQGGNRQSFVSKNLKQKLCDDLIRKNKVKENDIIRHSYSNSRMQNMYTQNSKNNNTAPTLDTRCDCLGICVKTTNNDKRLQNLVNNTQFEKNKPLNLDTYNQKVSEISQTLTEPHHNTQRLFDGLRIRKLTPKECWRLMGFSDECFNKASGISNAQLYKQAGNSIVVNVLEKILEELFIKKTITDQQQKLW